MTGERKEKGSDDVVKLDNTTPGYLKPRGMNSQPAVGSEGEGDTHRQSRDAGPAVRKKRRLTAVRRCKPPGIPHGIRADSPPAAAEEPEDC